MQGKTKKQALVFKPYHTGKIWDDNTLKRGLRLFAMTCAVSLMYLLVATALSFDIPVLRIVLNLLLIFRLDITGYVFTAGVFSNIFVILHSYSYTSTYFHALRPDEGNCQSVFRTCRRAHLNTHKTYYIIL